MTLEQAIERVCRSKLELRGLNVSQWAEQRGVSQQTASYQLKAAGKRLATLQIIARSLGLPISSIVAEAEQLAGEAKS
jgi:lambda repressor-like predicted transcriptional regulator